MCINSIKVPGNGNRDKEIKNKDKFSDALFVAYQSQKEILKWIIFKIPQKSKP